MTDGHAPQRPRILYAYPNFRSAAYGDVDALTQTYLARLRAEGFDVEGFCLTLSPPGPCLTWPDLDRRWRWGDRALLGMYERLEAALAGRDVLINTAGINLHPEYVSRLPVTTVFQCFDDPENSANLSRPAAAAYDLCLVGNAAELETYRSWGVRRVEWTPMGVRPEIYDPNLTEAEILEGRRDIDVLLMADRTSRWRTARLDRLAAALPTGRFHGRGWPAGYLPSAEQVATLRRTKIGPNLHNSTGPINYRTFYLPANGVLQICDNRSHLGTVFRVGEEVAGFETMDECIDLCRYYLTHDRERREMAVRGFRRAMRDYTEIPVFSGRVKAILRCMAERDRPIGDDRIADRRRRETRLTGAAFPLVHTGHRAGAFAGRALRWAGRRLAGR